MKKPTMKKGIKGGGMAPRKPSMPMAPAMGEPDADDMGGGYKRGGAVKKGGKKGKC